MSELLANKQVAYGLLVLGVVAVVVSIIIDPLRGNDIYLAPVQIVVLVVGVVLALAGAYLSFMYRPPTS